MTETTSTGRKPKVVHKGLTIGRIYTTPGTHPYDEVTWERRDVVQTNWKTGMTERVCRSTLAAEASHLANAVETVDWATIVLQEILKGKLNLKRWQEAATATPRFWATDCKSVYDYLTKKGTSMSKDKRMAIEGALLKETLMTAFATLRWID